MQRISYSIFCSILVLVIFGVFAGSTNAQSRDRGYERGQGSYNGSSQNYGMPRGVTHDLILRIARSAEDRSDDFKRELRRAMDRGSLDGTNREDRLNDQARRLERALDRVKKGVEKRRSYSEIRNDVRQAVSAGRDINVSVRNRWMGSTVETEWRRLKNEINALAKTFSLTRI